MCFLDKERTVRVPQNLKKLKLTSDVTFFFAAQTILASLFGVLWCLWPMSAPGFVQVPRHESHRSDRLYKIDLV